VLVYNVCGLKSKVSDATFVNTINRYDLIFLLETFVPENEEDFILSYFNNFKVHFEFAHRAANFGRHVGGAMFLVNKKSKFFKMCLFL